jgi:hypothetical protein
MLMFDRSQYELVPIIDVNLENKSIPMVDIQVEDDETFVLENDIILHNSAIYKFVEVRDTEFQAGMPLRGKVLNVYGKAPIEVMENAEVADIIGAIGLEFNEQLGDWIFLSKNNYRVKFESSFEVDDNGDPIVKEVFLNGGDRFLINKKWVEIDEIYKNFDKYSNFGIKEIELDEKLTNDMLSSPDYFHFRRLFDYRGFRKIGVKYKVEFDKKNIIICSDVDEIKYNGEWIKLSKILQNKDKYKDVKIEKVSQTSELTFQHKYLRPLFENKLNYSKVYISTDADPDGSSINNLLVNLFHEFFPELFWNKDMPFVYRILFPNIVALKGKKIKYYLNRDEFNERKEKDGIDESWKIKYYKGLGSMTSDDWEYIFNNLEKYSVPIYDDGYLDELLFIMFNENSDVRKEWLGFSEDMVLLKKIN